MKPTLVASVIEGGFLRTAKQGEKKNRNAFQAHQTERKKEKRGEGKKGERGGLFGITSKVL